MKKTLIITSLLLNIVFIAGASVIWSNKDNVFKRIIEVRADRLHSQFEMFSSEPAKVVFLGDSITEGGLWNELLPGVDVVNRGVGGNATGDLLGRIDQVFKLQPEKLFLMIGVNDLNRKFGPDVARSNYIELFDLIDKNIPEAEIYIQSVLPVNDDWKIIDNTHIPTLNAALKGHASQRGYTFIDLHAVFSDSDGQLLRNLSNDGIHLLGSGYELWRKEIASYLNDEHMVNQAKEAP